MHFPIDNKKKTQTSRRSPTGALKPFKSVIDAKKKSVFKNNLIEIIRS